MAIGGFPSIDPTNRLGAVTVDRVAYTVLQDAQEATRFYYIPSQLRLVEKTVVTSEGRFSVPEVHIQACADGEVRRLAISAHMTAVAPDAHLDAIRTTAVAWLSARSGQEVQRTNIVLSPVATIASGVGRILLLNHAGSASTLTPLNPDGAENPTHPSGEIALKGKDGESPDPVELRMEEGGVLVCHPVGRSSYGKVTLQDGANADLSDIRVDMVVEGIDAGICEAMLTGSGAGIIILVQGQFDALSVPANVRAKLVREKFIERIVKKEISVRTIRRWFRTRRIEEIRIVVQELIKYKNTFEICGTQTRELNDDQYAAIGGKLMEWLHRELAADFPAEKFAESEIDVADILRSKEGSVPRGTKYVLSPRYEEPPFQYNKDRTGTSEVVWTERFVVPQDFVASGVINLAGYRKPIREMVWTEVRAGYRPPLCIRLPMIQNGYKCGPSGFVAIKGDGVSRAQFLFENGSWQDLAADGLAWIGNLLFVSPETLNITNFASIEAELVLTKGVNADVNHRDSFVGPRFPAGGFTVRPDACRVVDFGGRHLPLNSLTVDPSYLLCWGTGGVDEVAVSFGADGGGLLEGRLMETRPISFPIFNAGFHRQVSICYGGAINAVRVEVGYEDRFLGARKKAVWSLPKTGPQNAGLECGFLDLTTERLGLRKWCLDFKGLVKSMSTSIGKEIITLELLVSCKGPAPASRALVLNAGCDWKLSTISSEELVSLKVRAFTNASEAEPILTVKPDVLAAINTTEGTFAFRQVMFDTSPGG